MSDYEVKLPDEIYQQWRWDRWRARLPIIAVVLVGVMVVGLLASSPDDGSVAELLAMMPPPAR